MNRVKPGTNWIPICFNQWLKYARKMRKNPDFKPKDVKSINCILVVKGKIVTHILSQKKFIYEGQTDKCISNCNESKNNYVECCMCSKTRGHVECMLGAPEPTEDWLYPYICA